jgi:hypothetical protein
LKPDLKAAVDSGSIISSSIFIVENCFELGLCFGGLVSRLEIDK